jgi:lysophospholipase L1-like esterase
MGSIETRTIGLGRLGAVLVLAAAVTVGPAPAAEVERPFFFRDGDRIVVVGDSITVQGDTVRYLENFLRTRFPAWRIAVRNGGINGQIARGGLAVMDTDVLVWKPTVVVVNYGMNDGRSADGVQRYQEGIVPYVRKLLDNGVRVVLCSNSPLDIGDTPGQFTDYNRNFDAMAQFARQLAAEHGIPFVDQFHFCHTLWGENRRRAQPVPVSDQTLAPHDSDFVHARAPGQLTMAYVILKTLAAPAEVSHAQLDAGSGRAVTRRCEIRDFRSLGGGRGIAFTRADEASPCWIDDRGALGLELVPFQDELNRMTLAVTGLAPGTYAIEIDGRAHGRYTARDLASGINLAKERQSPVYDPGRRVEEIVAVQRRETYAARQVRFFQPPAWLTIPDLTAQKEAAFARWATEIEQRDAAIAAAAAPRPHRYEIRRVGAQEGKP